MYKSLFLLLCVTFSCFSAQYRYDVSVNFNNGHVATIVNNKEVFCPCGKRPVIAMFSYGSPSYFCAQHVPEFELVRPIGKNEVDELLNSLGAQYNMNGSVNGK